jgi:polysaccharide biosynthesis/export protein
MQRILFILSCVWMAFALAACTGPAVVEPGSPAAVQAERAVEEYTLGTGDKVRILVYNEPTLSGEFTVNSGGALSLPLIGDVAAVGKTIGALKTQIETGLGNGYLREPKVSIDVLSFRPFYILGEVSKPGEYPFSSGLTVLNAVATAEGFSYRADKRVVHIRRAGTVQEQTFRLTPDLLVQPGDTLRIGERYF